MGKPERSEKPTPKKRKDARKKGMIAKSPEIVSWALILLISFVAPMLFRLAAPLIADLFLSVYALNKESLTTAGALSFLERGFRIFLEVVGLAGGAAFLLALVGSVSQVGFALVPKSLLPKASRLSPLGNVKKIFSSGGLVEVGKSLLKIFVVGGVSWTIIHAKVAVLASGQLSLSAAIDSTVSGSLEILRVVSLAGLALGFADYSRQRHSLTKRLFMTKQEVKDEAREADGDPMVKGRIRRLQRQLSRQRMMQLVPSADVVVVNPTHYAVAIKYEPTRAMAPVVVAKGSGHVAASLKKIAIDNVVPIVSDPLLARTLHATCKVGAEIPPVLFMAVARLLAFVYKLSAMARYYETTHVTSPRDLPDDLVQRAATM